MCDDCGELLGNQNGNPYYTDGDSNFCPDCALKHKIIDAQEWLKIHGIDIYDHAIYEDGVITAYQKWGKRFRKDEVRIF